MHDVLLGKGARHEPSLVARSTFCSSEVPHFVVPVFSMLPTVHRRSAIGDRNPCLRQLIACASQPRLLSKSWTRTPRQMEVSIHQDRPVTPLAYRGRRTTATGMPHTTSTRRALVLRALVLRAFTPRSVSQRYTGACGRSRTSFWPQSPNMIASTCSPPLRVPTAGDRDYRNAGCADRGYGPFRGVVLRYRANRRARS